MTNFCTIHQVAMTERTSKTKFAFDGSPKTYWAHSTAEGLCFGEGHGKAVRNERTQEQVAAREEEAKPDWDAKDRQSMAQTAMKSASEIVAALVTAKTTTVTYNGTVEDVKKMADEFYAEIMKLKTGETAEEEEPTF